GAVAGDDQLVAGLHGVFTPAVAIQKAGRAGLHAPLGQGAVVVFHVDREVAVRIDHLPLHARAVKGDRLVEIEFRAAGAAIRIATIASSPPETCLITLPPPNNGPRKPIKCLVNNTSAGWRQFEKRKNAGAETPCVFPA